MSLISICEFRKDLSSIYCKVNNGQVKCLGSRLAKAGGGLMTAWEKRYQSGNWPVKEQLAVGRSAARCDGLDCFCAQKARVQR